MKILKYALASLFILSIGLYLSYKKELKTYNELSDWRDNYKSYCKYFESNYKCFTEEYFSKFNEDMYVSEGILISSVYAMLIFDDKYSMRYSKDKEENSTYSAYHVAKMTYLINIKLLENSNHGPIDRYLLKRFEMKSLAGSGKLVKSLEENSELIQNVKNPKDKAAMLEFVENFKGLTKTLNISY